VLPFANMSADPEQEYVADGIAEDIITAISRYPSLFVIARLPDIVRELVGSVSTYWSPPAHRPHSPQSAPAGRSRLSWSASTGTALDLAFRRIHADRCEAIYVASGPLGPAKRTQIIALAAASQLPAIYSFRVFPADGGLMSYSADYPDLFRRAAGFVDNLLKGADPADLPVEPPRKFDLTVNLNTAEALGLTMPAAILARADEVIE
jgi:hypothetical protein